MQEPGLDDRWRDLDGEIRRKRSDTLVGTLRKEYGSDFLPQYRSDAKLGTVLDDIGTKSLSKLVRESYRRRK